MKNLSYSFDFEKEQTNEFPVIDMDQIALKCDIHTMIDRFDNLLKCVSETRQKDLGRLTEIEQVLQKFYQELSTLKIVISSITESSITELPKIKASRQS